MSSKSKELYKLPKGWSVPDPEEARFLHQELQKELPQWHLLYGVPVVTFAVSDGIDDVIFHHQNDPGRFTTIHLTMSGRTEVEGCPSVDFYGSFSEFLENEARITAWLKNHAQKVGKNE
jgi:hypothetical protein